MVPDPPQGGGPDLDGSGWEGETVLMKNITVSIDDDLYRKARVRAAELDTSVSAVVRGFLTEFAGEETDYDRRKRLEQATLRSIERFSASDRLSRTELHDRDALR